MACTPQVLQTNAKCLRGLSKHWLLAVWTKALCGSGPTPPPTGDTRITEDGQPRTTEGGDTRIIE